MKRLPVREPHPEERRRTCFRCVHALFSPTTTHCTEFAEDIDSELHAARDCPAYEEGK